jgi:hypothetical protein
LAWARVAAFTTNNQILKIWELQENTRSDSTQCWPLIYREFADSFSGWKGSIGTIQQQYYKLSKKTLEEVRANIQASKGDFYPRLKYHEPAPGFLVNTYTGHGGTKFNKAPVKFLKDAFSTDESWEEIVKILGRRIQV